MPKTRCSKLGKQNWALHICGMILLVLWDGHLAVPCILGRSCRPPYKNHPLIQQRPKLNSYKAL
ncbi:MAG: hypothetical protein V7L08_18880 [Nostoc sp.]